MIVSFLFQCYDQQMSHFPETGCFDPSQRHLVMNYYEKQFQWIVSYKLQ